MQQPLPMHNIHLRPIVATDEAFLRALYAEVRSQELEVTGWSDEQKWQFCNMQFDAQDRHYRAQYPDGEFHLIEQFGIEKAEAEAIAIGRMYCARDVAAREDVLIEMAIVAGARGRGIGSALIKSMLERAAASGHCVSLQVEPQNPARRLYARFGFVTVAGDEIREQMRWQPASNAGHQSSTA